MATTYTSNVKLAKMAADDPFDVALLNANADAMDAAICQAYAGRAARNLLINSDFSNPVNQRGQSSYTGEGGYTLDMWELQYGTNLDIGSGHITLSGKYDIKQPNTMPIKSGTTLTIAARVNVLTAPQSFKLATMGGDLTTTLETAGWQTVVKTVTTTANYEIGAGDLAFLGLQNSDQSIQVAWIAVYEGSYTADTLPAYVPRGYGVELSECQRYFVRYRGPSSGNALHFLVGATNGSNFYAPLRLPMPLRGSPTITYSSVNLYPYAAGGNIAVTAVEVENVAGDRQTMALRVGHETHTLATAGRVCSLRIAIDGYIDVSAEL